MTSDYRKIALITGASRGIGAKTAILFAQNGYDICINYKNNADEAKKVMQQIKQRDVRCMAVAADVSNEAEVRSLFSQVKDNLGAITVLVNNAGILKPQMPLVDMDEKRINQVLTTNVTSYFLCAKYAAKEMSTLNGGRGGSIVNVSSGASKSGSPNEYVDYAASKGAIDTMTIGFAKEVADQGIRVNCVRPGLIYTDMHADGGEPNRIERLKQSVPMKRGGHPEEVAEAIYWLASEKSSFTTGSFIDVIGGL
ncbi:SDR family oxidoreductase [Thalassotalea fusca]